ncbi:hypothetical protein THAOC_18353, partial [Thalassiosira oceanica]
MYFVIDALERLVCPRGHDPVSALHGGEPVGRKVMNMLGNSPHELGERSGLTRAAMEREWAESHRGGRKGGGAEKASGDGGDGSSVGNRPGLINRESLLAWAMSYGLSHNSRLGAVLSPCIVDESSRTSDGTVLIRPNPRTRFFTDDVQHGLCVYLGLAELLGFDLERDMPRTLYVVRRLQGWMGKEYVIPASKKGAVPTSRRPVSDARDVAETSAPQAFGVRTWTMRLDYKSDSDGGGTLKAIPNLHWLGHFFLSLNRSPWFTNPLDVSPAAFIRTARPPFRLLDDPPLDGDVGAPISGFVPLPAPLDHALGQLVPPPLVRLRSPRGLGAHEVPHIAHPPALPLGADGVLEALAVRDPHPVVAGPARVLGPAADDLREVVLGPAPRRGRAGLGPGAGTAAAA